MCAVFFPIRGLWDGWMQQLPTVLSYVLWDALCVSESA